MAFDTIANQDFDHAITKGFWRKITTRLTGRTNELLPYDEVRERFLLKGQHYLGLKQVPVEQIIGSSGRYRDFDRAFLPVQTRSRRRWVSIDIAHYEDVILPPVDLYKMGEVYFVKDGNHRVSVARQRGQVFVDAFVTEIDIPVPLTVDAKIDELVVQQEQLLFMEESGLISARPEAFIDMRLPGQSGRLLEHISEHRWYLGERRGSEIPFREAAASWYDQVYLPLVETLREQNLLREFPDVGEADLYLWIMDYQWYLRRAYREEPAEEKPSGDKASGLKEAVGRQLAGSSSQPAVRKLVNVLKRAEWIDNLILQQERALFYKKSGLQEIRPGEQVEASVPGGYEKLLEHIDAHRWYLGEARGADVPYPEAVASWYDNVYLPLVQIIREQEILAEFPGRSEADLYLWIIAHQWYLRQEYGDSVPIDQAARQFTDDYSTRASGLLAKLFKRVKGGKK